MSASEIIKELTKLSEEEQRAVFDKLCELRKATGVGKKPSMTSVRSPRLRLSSRKRGPKAVSRSVC